MKVCPLRMMALESSPQAIRNTGSVGQLMSDAGEVASRLGTENADALLRETLGCLEEDCAWWNGGSCSIESIADYLFGVKDALETIDLTIYHKGQ